jgi:hypothetical protein
MASIDEPGFALDGHRPYGLGSDNGRLDAEAILPTGVRVQVRRRFDGAWASGFHVFAAQPTGGYLVRRASDRAVLPTTFAPTELRLDPVPLPAGASKPRSPPAGA